MRDDAGLAVDARRNHRRLTITAIAFLTAGALHFVIPRFYVAIIPAYMPGPLTLVLLSGFFEMLGGAGLLLPVTRRAAAVGLIALLVAVFPANVEMLRQAQAHDAGLLPVLGLWLRLPLQPLLMWWVWRIAGTGNDLSG